MPHRIILAINPGSTSTRVALCRDDKLEGAHLPFPPPEASHEPQSLLDQLPLRRRQVLDYLEQQDIKPDELDAIAARGGPLQPVPGGVYRINEAMMRDAESLRFVEHPSKLACLIAEEIGGLGGAPGFVVDPISTDEYAAVSRISGMRELPRKSLTHALNMKRVARAFSAEANRDYGSLNLIVAHMGGGITIAVHERGRMIDSVDSNGEGPMSPQRTGALRVDDLAKLAIESENSALVFRRRLVREGGLVGHLGIEDGIEIEQRIQRNDEHAELIYHALAYQVAKHICALAAAVAGQVDAVILTGGLANSAMIVNWIRERVGFLAPVRVYPGEYEMEALCEGAMRALDGLEPIRIYPTGEPE